MKLEGDSNEPPRQLRYSFLFFGYERASSERRARNTTPTIPHPRIPARLDIYIVIRYISNEPAARAGPARNG